MTRSLTTLLLLLQLVVIAVSITYTAQRGPWMYIGLGLGNSKHVMTAESSSCHQPSWHVHWRHCYCCCCLLSSLCHSPTHHNILLDTVLATDGNKYSVTTASCQQRRQTQLDPPGSILAVEQRIVGRLGLPITTKQQSVFVCLFGWSVSQSRHMSAAMLPGSYRWLHLWWPVAPLRAAASCKYYCHTAITDVSTHF